MSDFLLSSCWKYFTIDDPYRYLLRLIISKEQKEKEIKIEGWVSWIEKNNGIPNREWNWNNERFSEIVNKARANHSHKKRTENQKKKKKKKKKKRENFVLPF